MNKWPSRSILVSQNQELRIKLRSADETIDAQSQLIVRQLDEIEVLKRKVRALMIPECIETRERRVEIVLRYDEVSQKVSWGVDAAR